MGLKQTPVAHHSQHYGILNNNFYIEHTVKLMLRHYCVTNEQALYAEKKREPKWLFESLGE